MNIVATHARGASSASPASPAVPSAEPTGSAGAGTSASRQLILDNAARLFRAGGYASVSLRDIAGACGMKAGSLYYHFSSKDAIVAEVLRIGVERVYDEVKAGVDALAPDTPAQEVFRVAIRCHLRALLELQDYTSANLRIFGQVPHTVRASHIGLRDAYEVYWSDLLARHAPPGARDPAALRLDRLFLIAAMNGSLEWFQPGLARVDEIADRLTGLFLNGLLNHPMHASPPAPASGPGRMARATPGALRPRRKSS